MLKRITDGRTDLVFDFVSAGGSGLATDQNGTSLIEWCTYYGDVSAVKFLLLNGETLRPLGANLGLNGAAFHGHWPLCEFLIENGADPNSSDPDNGETPLHSALCKFNSASHALVIKVLLAAGAKPNCVTKESAKTGCFMRDGQTKAETPLHRAAAFGTEDAIQALLDAGAKIDARDLNGDSPLSWASWHLRPAAILRKLCFGTFSIHPQYVGMDISLLGKPQ